MKKHLTLAGKMEDDGSDALSTASHNSGRRSHGEHSPSALHQHNYEETESLGDGSKKIRKKRNAYQKIEDDVRLKLLEAVQKNGETLKSAAKKYKINYSSAKSILHTYRKEGRILKKSAQERNVKRNNGAGGDMDDDSPHNEDEMSIETAPTTLSQKAPHNANSNRMEEILESKENIHEAINTTALKPKTNIPTNGMFEDFVNQLKQGSKNTNENENEGLQKRSSKPQVLTPKATKKPSLRNGLGNVGSKEETLMKKDESQASSTMASLSNMMNSIDLPNLANLTHLLQGNDRMKILESLYQNQATSSLGGHGSVAKDLAEVSTALLGASGKEFEMLSEVVNSVKSVEPKQNDEILMPRPVRFNTAQLMQEKIESKLNGAEDADWNETIEDAAIETFKSFMDAQLLLCDALKKASYLNNLMQIQKSKSVVSPSAATQGQLAGFKST